MSSAVRGIKEVLDRFAKLEAAQNNLEKPLKAAGVYMLGSIEQNFQEQGRPEKWQALSSKTKARRRKGKGKGEAQILINNADLKNSVTNEQAISVDASSMQIQQTQVGSAKIYGPRHNFGFDGVMGENGKWQQGRNPTPARQFLLFQEEDKDAIETIFTRFFGQALQ